MDFRPTSNIKSSEIKKHKKNRSNPRSSSNRPDPILKPTSQSNRSTTHSSNEKSSQSSSSNSLPISSVSVASNLKNRTPSSKAFTSTPPSTLGTPTESVLFNPISFQSPGVIAVSSIPPILPFQLTFDHSRIDSNSKRGRGRPKKRASDYIPSDRITEHWDHYHTTPEHLSLENIEDGQIGEVRVHKSGRISMVIGESTFVLEEIPTLHGEGPTQRSVCQIDLEGPYMYIHPSVPFYSLSLDIDD